MSEPHDPQSQPDDPSRPDWAAHGWTPPPPPPDWDAPRANGNGWRDPSAWAQGGYGAEPQGGPAQAGPAQGGPGQNDAPQPGPYGYGPYGQEPRGWTPPPPPPPWGPSPYGAGGGGYGGGWSYGWAPARPRRSIPSAVTALLLVVAVLVGLGIGHGVWRSTHNISASGGSSLQPNGGSSGNGGGFNPFGNGGNGDNGSGSGTGGSNPSGLSGVAAAVANDLVDINTTLSYQNGEAAGTGIVLTPDGYVLTNNHVISGATSIRATDIGNGQTYTAAVVGYDRTHDIAVIKLSGASGLKAAKLGNSARLTVGEAVVGLGNAGGVGGTPSSAPGQITALNQEITAQDESNGTSERLTGLIEINANIQPGDSGGALIDSNGDVIGVDTAASSGFSFQTQGNQGFAIPINQAVTISDTIRSGQATSTVHIGKTAFLGVEIDTSAAASNNGGATISTQDNGVVPNSPAAQAGLAPGDVITSLGGTPVTSASSLTGLMIKYHPGDRVSIGWTDTNGQSHQSTITLADGPPQ
jgi:S1-C subfamily serine protease